MKLKKVKFDKTKIFFKKLPITLAEHAFLVSLIFIFIAFLIGGVMFYRYIVVAERKVVEPPVANKSLQFKQEVYREVIEHWKERERNFNKAELEEYPNPFLGVFSVGQSIPGAPTTTVSTTTTSTTTISEAPIKLATTTGLTTTTERAATGTP